MLIAAFIAWFFLAIFALALCRIAASGGEIEAAFTESELEGSLKLVPGPSFEFSSVDGRLETEHAITPLRAERQAGRLVAVSDRERL